MPPPQRKWLFWTAVLLVAAAATLPLLATPGLLNTRGGGDSPFLLQRVQQLETAVLDGHFPARWMPDANYGYGYPFYNFYAPLSIYITLLFRFIGFSYVHAIELSQLAGFLVSAAGMFALGTRWFKSEWVGLLTAVAYTTAPFHLVNIYVRGDSLAEFWAMAFYPLVILAVDSVISNQYSVNGKQWAVAFLAIAYAALILSHNISALIFTPFLLLYCVVRIAYPTAHYALRTTSHRSPITDYGLRITAALLLALALSAWFFVPALAEKGLAQLGPVTEGYFHFSNHFLGVAERPLLQISPLFDYAVDGREAFRMGLVQATTVLIGVIVLVLTINPRSSALIRVPFSKELKPYRLFILLALLISTVMLLNWSRPLWERVPLLSFTQFPWRFLSVQAFAGAMATGVLALLPWRKVVVPVTAVLLIIAAFGNLKTDHLLLTDADVTGERLAQYEWFTGNIGTTVSAEYLPQTVQPRMATSQWLNEGERWSVVALTGELETADLQTAKAARQTWLVKTAVPTRLSFPTLYWPGWEAWIDGERVTIRPSPGSGLISLAVPPGKHTVELRLARTPVRLAAELVSLTAVLILLWLLRPLRFWKPERSYLIVGIGAFLLILVVQVWPEKEPNADDLTWDFAQMAYLHHAPDGIPFSNGPILQNYQYSQETLTAGDTLTIITNWGNAADGEVATLYLTTPAVNRYLSPTPPIIAEASQPILNGRATFSLSLPENAPSGLVMPQLLLAAGEPEAASGRALTPSGQERGELFLRPLRIKNPHMAGSDASSLNVKAIQAQQRTPEVFDIELAWFTAVSLSHNYNVALRLTDANGQFLQLADMQPGYGFQPSSLWLAGEWVNDWLALKLPPEAHEFPYVLVAQLYDVTTPNQPILTRRLGELWPEGEGFVFHPTVPMFALPEEMEEVTAVFADAIQLRGYNLAQATNNLNLTLYWNALTPGRADYTRFVHLIPVGQPQPVVQDDNLPQNGTFPTSQWTAREVVEDVVSLNVANLPAGEYQLAVGFYERLADGTIVLATAVDAADIVLQDNRLLLPTTITLP